MLSVIICTYNRDKYLYNCLKSVAENDFVSEDYEIILTQLGKNHPPNGV